MTQRQRRRLRRRKGKSALGLGLTIGASSVGIVVVAVLGYVFSIAAKTPAAEDLRPVPKGTSSEVLASNGTLLGYVQSDEYRTPVPFNEMPKPLREATIAIEDEHFYRHSGVDLGSIVRAAIKNIEAGKTVQGGSTLTQQLVRNTLIGNEPTIERKIREAALAQKLEERYSKNQILEKYLNSVPFGTTNGRTAIGVQAAAQTYFSVDAKDLTLEQSALLAGLPQAPSQYNPLKNPKDAWIRRNEVLTKMAGIGFISNQRAAEAKKAPLGTRKGYRYIKIKEPFFFDYVKELLIEKYGVNTVRNGGLKIYTTINPDLQVAARDAIDANLGYPGDPSSAVISIDPKNGYIKAMASNSSYVHSQFNLAAEGHRQPGSAFKPMALVTAVKRGIDPSSTYYESRKLDIPIPGFGNWSVSTYDESYGGKMSLEEATLRSDNTVYAQLALDLGAENVAETAKELGIKTKLDGYPSETLGGLTRGVSPLEMANAYSTLASGGIRCQPIAITKVVFQDGRSDELGTPVCERVIQDGVAAVVTDILEQNVQSGTGVAAGIGCPAAGKTGTTDNFNDAWFAGFTPSMTTAVWVGYPDALREMSSVHGIAVAGGTFPAQIWGSYMSVENAGKCDDFPEPSEPVEFQEFFGKYAKQGASASEKDEGESYGNKKDTPGKEKKKKDDKSDAGKTGPPDDGSGQEPSPTPSPPPPDSSPSPSPSPPPSDGGSGGVSH